MQNEHTPPLISAAEAAVILKVRAASVRRWTVEGKLPAALKMPGQSGAYLYDAAEVEAFKAQRLAAIS